jgi:hypothetical protein
MKNRIFIIFLLLLIFNSCQKEPEMKALIPDPVKADKIVTHDQIHNALAKVLSISLNERNVRLLLHAEIAKQFTYDFDILYDIVKDKEVESEKFGTVRLSELLANIAREAKVDFSVLDENANPYKNLQISSPVYFENWDPQEYIPLVVSLPADYQEGRGEKVRAFDRYGNESFVLEEELVSPILLVRQAERVDENGKMRVDPDGFVIPEGEREVTAMEAYQLASRQLKSAVINQLDPVIEVLNPEAFSKAIDARRSVDKTENRTQFNPGTVMEPGLKSATSVPAPVLLRVHPAVPYSIQIAWQQVEGAVQYEIYRQYETNPNYLIATVNADQYNYFDQYLNVGDHYSYSVKAVDAYGNRSPLSDGRETYASWRNNGSRDVIDKIFIDSDCWNWCCGLFDGKIELQYKTSYMTVPDNSVDSYPSDGAVNNLGQKTKDQQKNKWCTYNHFLFPWDIRNYSYSYRFKLIEDDGAGNGITIKLGNTFKIQFFKIINYTGTVNTEFKIADKDEDFGEVIILYWERKNGPETYTDGYNLIPDRGNARMYLKQ